VQVLLSVVFGGWQQVLLQAQPVAAASGR